MKIYCRIVQKKFIVNIIKDGERTSNAWHF